MGEQWDDETPVPVGLIIHHAGEQTSMEGVVAGKRFARERREYTVMRATPEGEQRLWMGFTLRLKKRKADDYAVNLGGEAPQVYAPCRVEDGELVPMRATVGIGDAQDLEAEERVDGSHRILSAAMPPEVYRWVADFVALHYTPPKRKKGPGVRRYGDYEVQHQRQRRPGGERS